VRWRIKGYSPADPSGGQSLRQRDGSEALRRIGGGNICIHQALRKAQQKIRERAERLRAPHPLEHLAEIELFLIDPDVTLERLKGHRWSLQYFL